MNLSQIKIQHIMGERSNNLARQIYENSTYGSFFNYKISEMDRKIAEIRQIETLINSFIGVEFSLQFFLAGIPKPKPFKLH